MSHVVKPLLYFCLLHNTITVPHGIHEESLQGGFPHHGAGLKPTLGPVGEGDDHDLARHFLQHSQLHIFITGLILCQCEFAEICLIFVFVPCLGVHHKDEVPFIGREFVGPVPVGKGRVRLFPLVCVPEDDLDILQGPPGGAGDVASDKTLELLFFLHREVEFSELDGADHHVDDPSMIVTGLQVLDIAYAVEAGVSKGLWHSVPGILEDNEGGVGHGKPPHLSSELHIVPVTVEVEVPELVCLIEADEQEPEVIIPIVAGVYLMVAVCEVLANDGAVGVCCAHDLSVEVDVHPGNGVGSVVIGELDKDVVLQVVIRVTIFVHF